jgi:hypothetical protein
MTAAPEGRRDPANSRWWLLVVAMAAAWPIANLLHNNWSMLITSDLERAALWWVVVFVMAAAVVVIASRVFRRLSLGQLAVAVALGLVLFFLFEWAIPPLVSLLAALGLPRRAANPAYLAFALLATVAVLRFARHAPARRIVAAFIVVGSSMSVASLAGDFVRGDRHDPSEHVARPLFTAVKAPEARPNVFLVILDGYSRLDVLSRVAKLDNEPIVKALRDRGFVVPDKSVANYPVTYLSVSSLLATDYVALPRNRFTSRSYFYDVIQGNNPWVASFRAMGYRYAHSGNVWGGSACSGREDFCLNSLENVPTREIDLSIVQMTPVRLFLPGVVTTTERGNLEFIENGLDQVYRRAPFFLFAHTMPPHPPFERRADCTRKKRLPSLEWWSYPEEYRDNTLCVNRQLTRFVDKVVARDPEAILVFASDHGSGFTQPFERPLDQWADEMIAERFPSFVAIRVPERCRPQLPGNLSNVNLGRFVVSCVSGTPPDYRPDRFFTSAHERHPSFGQVHEVTERVQALKLR